MKRPCIRAQWNHSTPQTPHNFCLGWEPITWGEGRRIMDLSPAAPAWLEQGACGFYLQVFVCFPVPSALSAPWSAWS